ncbi:uncharacterized protein EDB91DRAFT_183203 [Suillus paluster]|uniref:uncharacterized protein n=1 Tax=Suillus paluster TaxID=48578 RepID=UPI001B865275|nr:uncharacterized protein EDB91DRAFT_183203 [Suillus paluster]KAG1723120.1 hypothetical protein EDB91DRAFT_183203 [Suillus paluster]
MERLTLTPSSTAVYLQACTRWVSSFSRTYKRRLTSMNGDMKKVLQLEDGNFGSMQATTVNYQACDCQSVEQPRQSIAVRLLKVCGIGIVGWLLLVVFTHPGFDIARKFSAYYEFLTNSSEPGYPDPGDGEVLKCISSADWDAYYDIPPWAHQFPSGSESHFTLPVDSEALYFLSRGAFQYGTLTVEQSHEASDTVIVRVRAAYHKEEALDRANICHVKRQENENGISIYTPKIRIPAQDNKDQLVFDVTVTLPAGASGDVLYIKNLETSAPLFRHEVAALSDTVFFGSISLNTLHLPINVQSVAAETGIFTTANGVIKGHFRSNSSLKLITTNIAIDAVIDLSHNEDENPSELVMTTTNAPLDARVSLTTASGSAGEFTVDAQTTNAPLALTYVDSPVDSWLNSKASTRNAPATVSLHSAFEGSFSVGSSIIGPSLEQHEVEDPAGEGRQRHITISRSRGHIQGSVRWVGAEHSGGEIGFVQVSTTLSPARLIL